MVVGERRVELKTCHECGTEKPVDNFHRHSRGKRRNQCTRCRTVINRKLLYGIDSGSINSMLEEQGHACAICETQFDYSEHRATHIDHDHRTGKVRGILCKRCNVAIGMLRDSPTNADKAAEYLRKHGAGEEA